MFFCKETLTSSFELPKQKTGNFDFLVASLPQHNILEIDTKISFVGGMVALNCIIKISINELHCSASKTFTSPSSNLGSSCSFFSSASPSVELSSLCSLLTWLEASFCYLFLSSTFSTWNPLFSCLTFSLGRNCECSCHQKFTVLSAIYANLKILVANFALLNSQLPFQFFVLAF